MALLPQLTLSCAILLSGCLTVICITPPNPDPGRPWKRDRIGIFVGYPSMVASRLALSAVVLFHACLVVAYPASSCSAKLNGQLFQWNWHTSTCLFIIAFIGAPIRLAAYAGLGRNFTFKLAAPDRLITSGVYRYIQHPSYTGMCIIMTANMGLLFRWDASPACLIPGSVLAMLEGHGYLASGLFVYLGMHFIITRIYDEESMLRETFGVEWEKWHRSTRRLIPGVF
ncbi:hypothetical protein L249_1755 [Ophiocordyceps polyrhachis-furcata BCC 54312]|uniref:Protein-S-isoprenylcysteine O-methyltransferase n=1 Tax=Ophiocordyceps polyrhachis-furcata BCC 54312 TaxID=1330021 RepID=A0A367LR74_9HYPO|nr:hypothetical protein L249_1755 [Ophiocordyceps polyrhachis-furcata BCC 54312]